MSSFGPIKNLRILVYMGWDRWNAWQREEEYDPEGEGFLESILSSGAEIAALILRRGDRLFRWAERKGIPAFCHPPEYLLPIKEMKKALADNDKRTTRPSGLDLWLQHMQSLHADLGVAALSGWIPPSLMDSVKHGFLNAHPAPLPLIPGFWPEIHMVLSGTREAVGTIHKIDERFDYGKILGYTNPVPLAEGLSPKDICDRILLACGEKMGEILWKIIHGTLEPIEPIEGESFRASKGYCQKESLILWREDSGVTLKRRALCFANSPVYVNYNPLCAEINGRIERVIELDLHEGRFIGDAGDVIGRYGLEDSRFYGCPLIRTREGLAVVKLGTLTGEKTFLFDRQSGRGWSGRPLGVYTSDTHKDGFVFIKGENTAERET
jgi:folate-dependent phosphoribosylglycinamide formyltransferase PurN